MKGSRWLKKELRIAKKQRKKCKQQYSEWKNDEYNCAHLQWVWGILAKEQAEIDGEANFYTLNDLAIYYDRQTNKYYLDIESSYCFSTIEEEHNYITRLYREFKIWMESNHCDTTARLPMGAGLTSLEAKTLPQLFYKFKVYAAGRVFADLIEQ